MNEEGGFRLLPRVKRKFGPMRAMVGWVGAARPWDDGASRGTATWEKKLYSGQWICITASKLLRWMIGMEPNTAVDELKYRNIDWEWLPKPPPLTKPKPVAIQPVLIPPIPPPPSSSNTASKAKQDWKQIVKSHKHGPHHRSLRTKPYHHWVNRGTSSN